MKKILKDKDLIFWPVISGVLAGIICLPFYPPFFIFCVYFPIWKIWMKRTSYKEILISGWIFQFVFTLIAFHWMMTTIHVFGKLPLFVSILLFLVYCALAHLHIPFYGWIFLFLKKRFSLNKISSLLTISCLGVLMDIFYPFLFKWHLGYPWMVSQTSIPQLAEYVGFYGLSFFVFILNILFYLGVDSFKKRKKMLVYLSSIFFLILGAHLLGEFVKTNLEPPHKKASFELLQGNKGGFKKHQRIDTYMKITSPKEGDDFHVAIWPEVAYPRLVYKKTPPLLKKIIQDKNVHLITGAYSHYKKGYTNSMFSFDNKGNLLGFHHKEHLLAFGEYFPFRKYVPSWIKDRLSMIGRFQKGDDSSILPLGKIQVGGQICYEGMFPEFSRKLSQNGAHIFVNITNDSWFGGGAEPYQHMYITFARALEFRRPLLRVTNTGVSGAILADGTILEFSPKNELWKKTFQIPYTLSPKRTFYECFFYWIPGGIFLILILTVLYSLRRKKEAICLKIGKIFSKR